MSLHDRVVRTGRMLAAVAVLRSLLSGTAVALLMAAFLVWAFGTTAAGLSAAVGLIVAGWSFHRLRGPGFDVPSVSLWIEEHVPTLRYALVTAIEPSAPPATREAIAGIEWTSPTRDAIRGALAVPALAALGAGIALWASITLAPAASRLVDRVTSGSGPGTGPLSVTVEITPPSYTGRRRETWENPAVIRALVGSQVSLRVAGADSFSLMAGTVNVPARQPWRVGAQPVALTVRSANGSRLIAIDPLIDSVPAVRIREPARDTVLAAPAGDFALGADVRDDIGLRRAAFEYIVSTGGGETFTFTSGSLGTRRFDGAATGTISGRLRVASLGLEPGDVVHVRAVAFDLRDDSSAGRGASETRTIRIARAGEYDSVAVEAAAPPEADKAVLSQRMLINLAEALVRRRSRLGRETFAEESRTIGRDQSRLRKQVGDLVFSRLGDDPSGEHFHGDGHQHEGQELRPAMTPDELLKAAENAAAAAVGKVLDFEGDETPVVAVNRPLLEAYNFMWDASRELNQAAPHLALPSMYRALEAIQRARAAERLYLRSRPPRSVVDIDRVRLQGKEKGTPAAREPRAPGTGASRTRLARFERVVRLASIDPAAAADSLLLLRIDLLASITPAAAAAAAEAADALRNGRDAYALLATVRSSLGPAVARADSLSRWRGAR